MRRHDGFVLVEVLVAVALLIGAVVTLALVLAKSTATNMSAKRVTLATIMATDKLEELRGVPFDGPVLAVSPPDTLTVDREGFFDEPVPGWRRRWCITPLRSSPADAVVIAVAVSWAGSSPQAVITTIKVRRTA